MSKTLLLIKPDATERNLIGKILSIVEEHGFKILKLKMEKMKKSKAKKFYIVHKDKDFYCGLVKYMISGYTVGAVLEKENAVEELRKLVGKTIPIEAKRGTIRRKFGITQRKNSVHASDCNKSARYEIKVFFEE